MNTFLIIFLGMLFFGILERLFPHYKLPTKPGWLLRATIFNVVQLLVTILGYYTWERLVAGNGSLFCLDQRLSPFVGGLLAYFINTWIFYWWHRIRHESITVWLLFHQFHHSPERIEVITSFYKHPLEIVCNSIIMSILVYPILGLSIEGNAWLSVFSAFGEFIYHINVATPHWMGYFVQRPEMHCLHHKRNGRWCVNYSDIPLWDILGGTFINPRKPCKTGFSDDKEEQVYEMLIFKDVLKTSKKEKVMNKKKLFKNFMFSLLVLLGCLSTIGYIAKSDEIKGLGFASGSSPLPFVFSAYNGVETFSTTFELDITFKNGTNMIKMMDNKLYGMLDGPYNRKNVYGAIFSHGPFFDKPEMIEIRQQVLYWGLCEPGILAKEFEINDDIKETIINVRSKTIGNENKLWSMIVTC